MTNPYRALCAELLAALESEGYAHWSTTPDEDELCLRARALLDQQDPEGPTDEELTLTYAYGFAAAVDNKRGPFTTEAAEAAQLAGLRAVLAKWGTLPPQPVWAYIHYAWELEDAEGEWQAGGSANSLEDVQREGNRYLQTYEQDGPHKLIIQRHCVNTIEEVTND